MKLAEQWFEEYSRAGKIVGGEQLKGPQTATTVRFKNGKAIVTDGPFIESKEIIGGFAIVAGQGSRRGARDGQGVARGACRGLAGCGTMRA